MGSGETAPTMKAPHRQVFERIAGTGTAVPAVMLDTPFGFQENAPILAQQTIKYFSDSVSREVAVAGLSVRPRPSWLRATPPAPGGRYLGYSWLVDGYQWSSNGPFTVPHV